MPTKTQKRNSRNAQARSSLARGSTSFVVFNINDYVQVKLTERGKKCLRENYDKLAASYGGKLPFKFKLPTPDKDGWTRWQAWSLMQDLGQHVCMSAEPPFETTIRVEGSWSNTASLPPEGRNAP